MDLQYMFPFLRTVLAICAAFSSVLCILIIIQLVLFGRISKKSPMDFGRLAIAHKTVGGLLACVSALFAIVFGAASLLLVRPVPLDDDKFSAYIELKSTGNETRPPYLITSRPAAIGETWGQPMSYTRQKGMIPEGDGIIEGRILVDGNGAPGESIRLILNEGYHTHYARTDAEGIYRVRVPKGEYSYNGWKLDPRPDWSSLDGKTIMYNGVIRKRQRTGDCEPGDQHASEEFHAKLDEIFQTRPPDKIEEEVYELYNKTYPRAKEQSRYTLTVNDTPARVPPLEFATPIHMIYPEEGQAVAANALRIEWMPYPNAASYRVSIQYKIMHPGGSTTFRDLAVFNEIERPYLPAEEIFSEADLSADTDYIVTVSAKDAEGYPLSPVRLGRSFTIKPESITPRE